MDNNIQNGYEDSVTGVENVTKKGKGKGAAVAGVAAVAVIAGGGVAAYNLSDYVKNQVKLAIMKPADYYAWVNEENSKTLAQEVSKSYRESLDKMERGSSATVALEYTPSAQVKDMLIEETGLGGADDEESKMALDIINNLNSIEIGSSAEVKKSEISGSVFASLNSDKLVSLDYAMEQAGMEYFMRIPELSEKWLSMDMNELGEELDSESQAVLDAYSEAMMNPQDIISPEEIETLFAKYTDVWSKSISDVTLEKKESVDICDITVEYTVISTELTEEKAAEICKNFIEEAKNDDIIKGIVVDKLEVCSEDEYTDVLEEALSGIEDNLNGDSDETVNFNVYVDPKGVIRGYVLDAGDEGYVKWATGMSEDEVRCEFIFNNEGEDVAAAELKAKKSGESYNGSLEVKAEEETVSVDFENFEVVNKEMGYIKGVFTINIPEVDPIVVKCDTDGSSLSVSTDVTVEDINIGTFTLKLTGAYDANPSVPSSDDAIKVNPESDDFIKEYVTEEEVQNFVKELLLKIGINEEYSEELSKLAADSAFNEGGFGGASYYDDYYDDYDFDEDFSYSYEDEYAADAVEAGEGEAYLSVADTDFEAYYTGGIYSESLCYNAKVAKINGDGTYTVSVTADTDGYKNMCENKPNGLYMLSVECDEPGISEDAEVVVKSVKIDGKEYELDSDVIAENYGDMFSACIYFDGIDYECHIDGGSVKEWTTIEVTFEIKNA